MSAIDLKTVRLSLDVSPELHIALEKMAADGSCSMSDVLRRAIALFGVAASAKKRGLRFGVLGLDGQLETEIVGL